MNPLTTAVNKIRKKLRMEMLKDFSDTDSELLITLCDTNRDIATAMREMFLDAPHVEVAVGSILDLRCDALVSPANSFGDMDGGLDRAIDDHYRGHAQTEVKRAIASEYLGELPVGQALIIEMKGGAFPHLICAPTMRVPGRLYDSINAYLAMRAILVRINRYNARSAGTIRSVAIPGLCTGVGGMGYFESAKQMRVAYENVVGGQWKQVVHSSLAPFVMQG